jgi:hypothetical protein
MVSGTGPRKNKLPSHYHIPLLAKSKNIRLLEVHLGPGYEPIKCTLSQHHLKNKPSYIALSYTWDLGAGRRHIECDGMDLEIGENLWNFFYEFRKKHSLQQYHSKEPRSKIFHLWIDAICIDQTNLKERNQQVAQMRDVYTSAESVIVWLGLAQRDEELAFLLTRHPNLLHVEKLQSELLALLSKPYFTRVWVVQEFVLARSVVIWCGEYFADAVMFDKLWREDEELPNYWKLSQSILKTPAWPLFKYRRDFRRRGKKETSSNFRLRNLLLSFSSSQSSEVYDKVYGFLGISSNNPEEAHIIHPDYSKTPVEVLADVLRNQCCQPDGLGDQGDHELLIFLLRMLHVSRIDFARYLLRNKPRLEEHIYVLAISDLMITSICFMGSITRVGSYEHINELSHHNTKTALLRSSTHIPQLSNSNIRMLSSAIATPETALALEFDKGGRSAAVLQSAIQNSTQAVMQGLVRHKNEDDIMSLDQKLSLRQAKQDIKNTDFRQLLSRSLTSASETYRTAKRISKRQEIGYQYRKYAAFVGTNDLIGVMCDESSMGKGPAFFDSICMFDSFLESSKALLIERHSPDRFIVVGSAIVANSKSEPGSGGIVQSLQKMFRTNTGDTASIMLASDFSPQSEKVVRKLCFHCHLSDLLELSRCGILNESQLDRLLEHSLRGENDDEMHKCKVGTGQYPSLEFGT